MVLIRQATLHKPPLPITRYENHLPAAK
ncbi:unnamed protein product, partial [Rotaria magnacalcarata]